MKKKVVIYARFSSHTQTEQSIEGQLRECYDYAKKNDYLVVAEYIDRAISGTSDKRPQFLKMIEDSKKKNFEFVLVYQLDRFARNRYDSANYKAKLKRNGIRVLSAKENISDDASGILVEGMLESMAEYYSAELSQKVKRGIKESLRKGNFIGGHGILGYDIVDKKWVINEYEAKLIRDMFDRYSLGEKAKEIIDRLNTAGIATKQGNRFTQNMFSRIIRNKKYMGILETNGTTYTEIIPPIIDEKTYTVCNAIMDKHKHKQRTRELVAPYILSGKIYCGICGSQITAEKGTSHTGKVYNYYKCARKKKNTKNCTSGSYSRQALEDTIFKITIEEVLKPNMIDEIAKIIVEKYNSDIKDNTTIQMLHNSIKEVNRSINAMLKAIESGIITKTTKDRLLALEEQKGELETKLSAEEAIQIKPLKYEEVKSFITYFAKKKYRNDEEKNEFFNIFINRVIVYKDSIAVFFNNSPHTPKEIILKEKADKTQPENKNTPFEFERRAVGGGRGIRTPVGLHPNGFQDRLVMTTSIFLHIFVPIYYNIFCEKKQLF